MKEEEKNTPYTVTEWQWLEILLRLYSLENSAEKLGFHFEFPSADFPRDGKTTCAIFSETNQELHRQKASKEEQLEYYEGWAELAQQAVLGIVNTLPVLSKSFDINKDMVIEIRYDYGMGSSTICKFLGNEITWIDDE